MIIVDTSVWVEHLRSGHVGLAQALGRDLVLGHAWVAGELSLDFLSRRREILGLLRNLPQAVVATPQELSVFIEQHNLYGLGIGYVDVQLLASTRLTPDARLTTLDKRLAAAASRLGVLGTI